MVSLRLSFSLPFPSFSSSPSPPLPLSCLMFVFIAGSTSIFPFSSRDSRRGRRSSIAFANNVARSTKSRIRLRRCMRVHACAPFVHASARTSAERSGERAPAPVSNGLENGNAEETEETHVQPASPTNRSLRHARARVCVCVCVCVCVWGRSMSTGRSRAAPSLAAVVAIGTPPDPLLSPMTTSDKRASERARERTNEPFLPSSCSYVRTPHPPSAAHCAPPPWRRAGGSVETRCSGMDKITRSCSTVVATRL